MTPKLKFSKSFTYAAEFNIAVSFNIVTKPNLTLNTAEERNT